MRTMSESSSFHTHNIGSVGFCSEQVQFSYGVQDAYLGSKTIKKNKEVAYHKSGLDYVCCACSTYYWSTGSVLVLDLGGDCTGIYFIIICFAAIFYDFFILKKKKKQLQVHKITVRFKSFSSLKTRANTRIIHPRESKDN